LTGAGGDASTDAGVEVTVEVAAALLNPNEVPVQQRTRHICNDDMGQKKRFAVQTTIGDGVPYHRTNAGLRKAKAVAEKVFWPDIDWNVVVALLTLWRHF